MLRNALGWILLLRLSVFVGAAPDTANSTGVDTAAVCTPDLCLVGANSLAAGVHVSTSWNGMTWQLALLPGTYTSSASAFQARNASSPPSPFGAGSTPSVSTGFGVSGSLSAASSAAYSVSTEQGLTTYSSPLYQGTATHFAPPQDASIANATSSDLPSHIESLLLSSNTVAIAQFTNDRSSNSVLWDSLYDAGQLPSGAGSGGINILDVQARGCAAACSSGGVCTQNGTCACTPGFQGQSCACPSGCTDCDDGITGTGLCLDSTASNVTLPCWTTAANACDPSCASCSGPNATCLTCQSGLQPDSSDATKCVTATTASTNGTFVTCPERTFWSSSSSSCVDCNPLCESCFAPGADGCLSCRSPNVLMPNGGGCVAYDSGTGVCNGAKALNATSTAASGWVYDNDKKVCDALPPKCAAGGINGFSSSSSRSDLQCSACLPGSFLVKGACVDTCPDGYMVSSDGKSCQVLTFSGTCVATCSSNEYFDEYFESNVIPGFGVCLEDLVTVAATSAATASVDKKWRFPWWGILAIVLVVLLLLAAGLWWFRKREQKRRRAHTAKFAKELGDKEVDKKLAELPVSVAYPPIPRADKASSPSASDHHLIPMTTAEDPVPLAAPTSRGHPQDVVLAPRFVLEDPASPISPSPSHFPPEKAGANLSTTRPAEADSRWSLSSYGSATTTTTTAAKKTRKDPLRSGTAPSPPSSPPPRKTFTTRAGNKLILQSKNPFRSA
ncbi:hypothetical protein JCM8202v2_001403 [Rhodotorula sphaerocarpa]